MSFFDKLKKTVDAHRDLPLLREGARRTYDEVRGLVNPNHRHDEPHEKEEDAVRAEINAQHRFESFAGERSDCAVKWHIDGHDYFWALSEILDSAQEHIFILDWWLSPELYLRRPPAYYPEWRLDRLLLRKAQQGVKIYVIVYKEVTQTMTMSSSHTKHALEDMHENIAVMRHPDHIGSANSVEFWSHHEKVVVVDNYKACIGGLDICFGRWDTSSHPLADAHPTQFFKTLFPGQDYNNARHADFQNVDHYAGNEISVLETPRMPWHDVHMTFTGPAVLDVVQHFVERWNEVKKRKYKHESRYDWLSLPHDIEAAPEEAVLRHPHREHWLATGRRFKQRWHGDGAPPDDEVHGDETYSPKGTCHVQVVRSVSDWSHGVLTERSIQNAYIQMIREARHFVYIENQFFISNTGDKGPIKNRIAQALVERIVDAAQKGEKFRVLVVFPEVPCFAGSVETTSIKTILAAQWATINRGGRSIYEEIRKAGYEPTDYIRFFHLRTYDRINAPVETLIKQQEQNAGVTFDEAQVALARQWLGPDEPTADYTVRIKSVEANTGDQDTMGISDAKREQAKANIKDIKVPSTLQEATDIIKQFESGATRGDEEVADTVSQHVQKASTGLLDEKWLGSEQEEKDCYVSELVYIHSKVMIVDDCRVIMGSANLNDRSQRGDGDSEIALVVDDTDWIESRMDGKPFMATRFAASLRRKLFRKHLGLVDPQICESDQDPVTPFMRPAPIPNPDESGLEETQSVIDPLDEDFLTLWNKTARNNREVFTDLFRPVPTNLVRTWAQFKEYVPKVKTGHIADPSMPLDRIKERLASVRGNLVEAPIEFLIDERALLDQSLAEWNPTLPIYI